MNTNIKQEFLSNLENVTSNLINAVANYNKIRKQYDSLDLGTEFPDAVDCGNGYTGAEMKAVATSFDAVKNLLEAGGNAHYTNLHKIVSVRVR